MQVILNKKGDTYDGKISDVWSCGVMLFVTLVGQYPFERPEDKGDPQKMHKMIRRIVNVDYKLPSRVEVSDECKVSTTLPVCALSVRSVVVLLAAATMLLLQRPAPRDALLMNMPAVQCSGYWVVSTFQVLES